MTWRRGIIDTMSKDQGNNTETNDMTRGMNSDIPDFVVRNIGDQEMADTLQRGPGPDNPTFDKTLAYVEINKGKFRRTARSRTSASIGARDILFEAQKYHKKGKLERLLDLILHR